MQNCITFGSSSDIYQGIRPMLLNDGWALTDWNRESSVVPNVNWDLVLMMLGRVSPVGKWFDLDSHDFDACVESNVLLPVRLLRQIWPLRNPCAKVCFFAGSNPNKPMVGYSPYHLGKMALLKTVEQLDLESEDCSVFALAPGYVPTKIHAATLAANWPNERIARGDDGTPIERIWECLKWCISQPKEVVGGRNICTSDHWDGFVMGKSKWDMLLADELKANPAMFKLRRVE